MPSLSSLRTPTSGVRTWKTCFSGRRSWWTVVEGGFGRSSSPNKLAICLCRRSSSLASVSLLQFSPAGRDGEEEDDGGSTTSGFVLHRHLPKGCYSAVLDNVRAEHTTSSTGAVIIGRKVGPISTSWSEALIGLLRRSSTLPSSQVVRPRKLGSGRRQWFSAGDGPLSAQPTDLGGDAWRSPTLGGRDTQGPDRFSFSCFRVFFVTLKALSSNCKVLRASDARGLHVKIVPATPF